MKTSELVIGDLLYLNWRPVRVDAIGFNGSISYSEKGGFGGIGVDKLSPIPITEEILVKLGFSKVYSYSERELEYDLESFPFTIVFDRYKKEWYAGTYMCGRESDWIERQFDCRFLHQLQHALRLCGIEKEIEL